MSETTPSENLANLRLSLHFSISSLCLSPVHRLATFDPHRNLKRTMKRARQGRRLINFFFSPLPLRLPSFSSCSLFVQSTPYPFFSTQFSHSVYPFLSQLLKTPSFPCCLFPLALGQTERRRLSEIPLFIVLSIESSLMKETIDRRTTGFSCKVRRRRRRPQYE